MTYSTIGGDIRIALFRLWNQHLCLYSCSVPRTTEQITEKRWGKDSFYARLRLVSSILGKD